MKLKLAKTFSSNSQVDAQDVRAVKLTLNKLGYYSPVQDIGISDIPDRQIFDSIKVFQKDSGLPATGSMKPDDDTERSLNKAEKKVQGRYVWKTAGDNKVRPAHAAREGEIFSWDNPPEGGNPGEDYNCRCWAVPLADSDQKKKDGPCKDCEVAYVNASGAYVIAEQKLNHAKTDLNTARQQLSQIETNIKNEVEAVNNSKREGAVAGAIALGAWGSRIGPGTAMEGAGVGLGAGTKIGGFAHDISNIINSKKPKVALEAQKIVLEKTIKQISDKIDGVLQPEFDKALQKLNDTRSALRECERMHDDGKGKSEIS